MSCGSHQALGTAIGPLADPVTEPGDATGRELLALVPGFQDPAEEAAFLRQLVEEGRVVTRGHVKRLYDAALDIAGA